MVYLILEDQVKKHKITGAYVGLAAAYTPEIFTLLNQHITGRFVNCQIHKNDYEKLLEYQPLITTAYAYPYYFVEFELHRTDIIRYLLTERGQFSIYDLDFMGTLTKELINKVLAGIIYSIKLPATVIIWHTAGRSVTNQHVEKVMRPMLVSSFAKVFHIQEHIRIDYYEGFPMRGDIITLEQKEHARRNTAA